MSARRKLKWNGLCPAGKHGLDFKGQTCDLCPRASPAPAAPSVEVVDVPPSDFEAGAVHALALLRSRVQERLSAINEIEQSKAGDDAGVCVMLNGARDLLAAVRSDFEHRLLFDLHDAEVSHLKAKGGK